MKTHALPPTPTNPTFLQDLDDILGGTTCETLGERVRPPRRRPVADRPCDGCGDAGPTVDLWAEHPEADEQLWLCIACGD